MTLSIEGTRKAEAEQAVAEVPGLSARDWRIAASLSLFLTCVYLLTFSGVFRSIDELALFGVTENLVQSGRTEPLLVAFAPFHNPVGLFEAGYPLLAAPLYSLAGLTHTSTGSSNILSYGLKSNSLLIQRLALGLSAAGASFE